MKKRRIISLLLTGAILTCSQTVFAIGTKTNQEEIALLKKVINQLEAKDQNDHEIIIDDKTVALDTEDITAVSLASDSVTAEEDVPTAIKAEEDVPAAVKTLPVTLELSETQKLIKNYMEASDSTARIAADKAVREAFATNHQKTCIETVKYIQNTKTGNEAKFGTLFSLMDIAPRYATKGTKSVLNGIRESIEMREKDGNGVFFKEKVKLTSEMLCTKK